jgi:SAM-dependent methyltransferase
MFKAFINITVKPHFFFKKKLFFIYKKYYDLLVSFSKKRSRQGLYEFLELSFSKINPGSFVLTVGAGGKINDLLNSNADKIGFKILSLDINPDRQPDIIGDICQEIFRDNVFDVVVCCEVLEHLVSPHSGINNIHKTLKPGGLLILSTPFVFPIHDAPNDYFRITRFGLDMLLEDFESVEIKERNTYFEAVDVLWMRLLFEGKREFNLPTAILISFIYFIKRPFTLLLGKLIHANGITTGYTAVANKKL